MKNNTIKRVLIYRLGSLGDTVIALPCFHLIARVFPNAERHLLCNLIDNSKASHTQTVLGDSGLIHNYISYPVGLRNLKSIVRLRHQIKALQPEILIYLAASRGRFKALRDAYIIMELHGSQEQNIALLNKLQENNFRLLNDPANADHVFFLNNKSINIVPMQNEE